MCAAWVNQNGLARSREAVARGIGKGKCMNETDQATNEDTVIKIGAASEDRTRAELIDDMALPFLDLAEKIEAARLNDTDPETWKAILETNLFLWRFISNFLPTHFSPEVSSETEALLGRISEFMIKVTVALADDGPKDDALLDKVVRLNLNMCDQILGMREDDGVD
jgi:hypothetical protein